MGDTLAYDKELSLFRPVSLEEINSLSLQRRFDSKYLIPLNHLSVFLRKLSPDYQALEINGDRVFSYDTQYFDSPQLTCYMDHQNQRKKRFKIRQRRYAVNGLSFLEVKMKTNKGKTVKKRISLNENALPESEKQQFIESCVPVDSSELIETASNAFRRISLVSFDTRERITIDYDLLFRVDGKEIRSDYFAIVEVKREHKYQQSPVTGLLRSLNVRSRGFSKYCMSLALLKPGLKKNMFKSNILYLKKLKYDQFAS